MIGMRNNQIELLLVYIINEITLGWNSRSELQGQFLDLSSIV